MKRARVISTAVVSFLLGTAASACAQQQLAKRQDTSENFFAITFCGDSDAR